MIAKKVGIKVPEGRLGQGGKDAGRRIAGSGPEKKFFSIWVWS